MMRRLMVALDVALAATVVYALTAADCWPTTAAAHLALVRAGVVVADVGSYYPVWGRCVAWFGLNAGTLSALAGGCAAGLVAWNVARIRGVWGGVVAAALFAFSPPVWRAATQVDPSLFDLSLVLLALVFAGGRHWRWNLPVAIAVWGVAFLDLVAVAFVRVGTLALGWTLPTAVVAGEVGAAFAFSLKARRGWARWCVVGAVAIALVTVPVLGARAVAHPTGGLADAAAGEILAKVGPKTKWLVTDGVLEDAFARRLALKRDAHRPFLVCAARNFDEVYLSNLVRKVSSVYPGDAQLRIAASLGVKAFLEDLPFADTNVNAVVFAWGRELWTEEELGGVRARLECVMGDGRDAVCEYVRQRLGRLGKRPVRPPVREVSAAAVDKLIGRLERSFASVTGARRPVDMALVRERARELVRADRMNPLGNAVLGTLAAQDGDVDVAELYLRRAVAKGDVPPLIYNDLAETLRRRWKYKEAEEFARRALALSPGNWRVLETLTDILQSRNAPHDEVEDVLREAERLAKDVGDGEKTTLLYLRAVECLRMGQEARANMLFGRLKRLPISERLRQRVKLVAPTGSR